jgi:hypothetical protein
MVMLICVIAGRVEALSARSATGEEKRGHHLLIRAGGSTRADAALPALAGGARPYQEGPCALLITGMPVQHAGQPVEGAPPVRRCHIVAHSDRGGGDLPSMGRIK